MSQVRNGKAKLPRRPSSEDLEAPLTDSAAGSPSSSGRLERRTLPSSSGGVYLSEVQLNQARMRTAHSALLKTWAGKLSLAQPDEAASKSAYIQSGCDICSGARAPHTTSSISTWPIVPRIMSRKGL